MQDLITPDFDHSALEDPSLLDLVAVFENSWNHYVIEPARELINTKNFDVAALTVLTTYFEGIWIYKSGEDSTGKSRAFFIEGFCECFDGDPKGARIVAKEIYKHVRCGLAHSGMLSKKVQYSREGNHAFYVTYPKNADGTLDTEAEITSIVLNAERILAGIEIHFKKYISELRGGEDSDLQIRFDKIIRKLWGVGEEPLIIGMTEEEFRGDA
jgi:hypothetical protein|tara:strand:+ start:78 stop:716 length:639 start_codon:yes stop_codon:yes gene_type:complete